MAKRADREGHIRALGPPSLLFASVLLVSAWALASDLEVQSVNPNTDTYGARLTLSRSCTAGDATIPDGAISSDPAEKPCGSLTANDVDIVSGSVRFKAGESLSIGEGFSVASGATFVAEVGASVLGAAYLRDESPDAVREYYARFYLDPSNLALTGSTDRFDHFLGYDAQGNLEFVVGVTYDEGLGEHRLFVTGIQNNGIQRSTKGECEVALGTGWGFAEVHWKASTGTDGDVEVSVNGGAFQSLASCRSLASGLANSEGEISAVEWGVRSMPDGDLGTLDLDDFDSRRAGPIGSL